MAHFLKPDEMRMVVKEMERLNNHPKLLHERKLMMITEFFNFHKIPEYGIGVKKEKIIFVPEILN